MSEKLNSVSSVGCGSSLGMREEYLPLMWLEDKLRHIKIFRSLFEQHQLYVGLCPPENGWECCSGRSRGKTLPEQSLRRGKHVTGWAVALASAAFGKAQSALGDWEFLNFVILDINAFTGDAGLRVGLLMEARKPKRLLSLMATSLRYLDCRRPKDVHTFSRDFSSFTLVSKIQFAPSKLQAFSGSYTDLTHPHGSWFEERAIAALVSLYIRAFIALEGSIVRRGGAERTR